MPSLLLAGILFAAAQLLGACSENGSSGADLRADLAKRDLQGAEGTIPGDTAADLVAAETSAKDLAAESSTADGRAGDSSTAADAALVDSGPKDLLVGPGIYGNVSRSVSPVLDGKGVLYVGLFNQLFLPPLFPPVVYFTDSNADLSSSGAKVPYSIPTSAGTYFIYAYLDDNKNGSAAFMYADPGDLYLGGNKTVTVSGTAAQKLDIVLDTVSGGFTDGGMGDAGTLGGLTGKITATATLVGDGIGNIYITLTTQPPPATAVYQSVVGSGDLSSPYNSESYYLSAIQPGTYYLYAYLDDNSNGMADKGDLVPSSAVQVHVVAGSANPQNLVLDQTQP